MSTNAGVITHPKDTAYRYRQGLGNAAAYQVSGHPFITGSTSIDNNKQVQVVFPQVAKSVTVINRADVELYVYFTDGTANTGAGGALDLSHTEAVLAGQHYISLDNKKDSITFDTKCKEIYIANKSGGNGGAFQVLAELTSIHPNDMYALSGSGLTDVDTAADFRTKTV
tara:strand:+ start:31 stop:537 length:507 start_codon:yes stop_codon:yes gene_type:complete